MACFGTRARAEQKVIYVTEEEQSGVQLSSTTPTVDLVEYTESTSATVAEEPVTEEPSEPLTEAPTVPTETEAITEPEMTESTTQATTAPTEWTPPATEPVVPEPESTEAPTTGNPDDLLYGELPYLGSFDLVVGETLSMDVSSYRTGNTSVSDPSAARVWKEESSGYGGSRARIYFAAYATGYVQVYGTMYVNDRSISWLLAELYISPNGDTESISFAETDGKVPTIEIPEFDFNFPNG